jgi:hypothetical protein
MSNDEKSVFHRRPRTTFVEDLSPQGPLVAFDSALETVREKTRALSRALAVDFFGAREAADALSCALVFAMRAAAVMRLSAYCEAARQFAGMRNVAETMLALAPGPSTLALAPGPSLEYEIALFWTGLGSLQRSLTRLRTAVEPDNGDTAAIARVLGLKAPALPGALNGASEDLQLVMDALESSPASRGEARRPQLAAAQQKFRDVVERRQLDAELFRRAKRAVRDKLTRAMLANVALLITFAIDSSGQNVITDQGEEPR